MKVEINTPKGGILKNPYPQSKHILPDNDVADPLGIKRRLQIINLIKRFTPFTNYLVRCDLFDENENVFNGKPSSVLGCFNIVGQPFDRVNFYSEASTQRKIKQRNDITSILCEFS